MYFNNPHKDKQLNREARRAKAKYPPRVKKPQVESTNNGAVFVWVLIIAVASAVLLEVVCH